MLVTVFTPTYNRAHLLPRLYESLCKQTFTDFEWLIVDDGSTDSTKEVINKSANLNANFSIRYIHQENGGKHRAINYGVREAEGDLFFIADSDDWLPDNALAIVAEEYEKVKSDRMVGGVAGLDCFDNGRIVGGGLPKDAIDCTAIDIRMKHHVSGDLKEVFRTKVLQEFPFPEIEGERFCPEVLLWNRIASSYKLRYFNKIIYLVEYQADGITSGIVRARMQSPIASMMTYAEMTCYKDVPLAQKVKAAINYWRFRFCKKGNRDIPCMAWYWNVLMPLGWLMHKRDKAHMLN